MYVEKIKLTSFRNYDHLEQDFSRGINYIFGANGEGKTSLVEAIGFLSMIKSFKTANEKEVINGDNEFCEINAKYVDEEKPKERRIVISKKGKYLEDDGVEVKKISSIVGDVKIISFLPKDTELFKGSPSARRRFLDQNISMIDKNYLRLLNDYYKNLEQVRYLIKDKNFDLKLLDIYLDNLSQDGVQIASKRKEFVFRINSELEQMSSYLENQTINLKLNYHQDVSKDLEVNYKEVVKEYLLSEKNKVQIVKGIHLDDLSLDYQNKDLGLFGSQGQNRISVIALKLSLFKIIKQLYQKEAILILDDVLSELDKAHEQKLMLLLGRVEQVFVTGTDIVDYPGINYYQVENKGIRRLRYGS